MRRVLLVDDEPWILEIVADEFGGWELTEARSGHQAKEILSSCAFDLVVTDVQMPNGTGVELFEFSGTLDRPPPFIFMTGFGELPDTVRSSDRVLGVVDKPFKDNAIADLVRNFQDF